MADENVCIVIFEEGCLSLDNLFNSFYWRVTGWMYNKEGKYGLQMGDIRGVEMCWGRKNRGEKLGS